MKKNLKVLLVVPILVFAFAFLSRTVYGSWLETLNIIRQTPPPAPTPPVKPEPPNPPTPPIKPEPSPPPTPPCNDPGCPTPTPSPSPTPTSTPAENGGNGGNGGTGGAPFQFGGPPPPGAAGQVLGAAGLGKTGTTEENIFLAVFTLGSLLTTAGVRKLGASRK